MNSAYDRNAALVRSFVDALNRHDLDDFVALLSDDVELRTPRGIRRGRREAAQWFENPLYHLDLRFEQSRVLVGEDEVIGIGDLVFTWKETGEVAERLERAAIWKVGEGLIRSWEPFETPAEALRAAGILRGPE
jgi:ketosteroid isomerase-like protein